MRMARAVNNNGNVVGLTLALNVMLYNIGTNSSSTPTLSSQFSPYDISDSDIVVGALSNSAQQGVYYRISDNTVTRFPYPPA
ncbi:MAG: hypothetical protein QM758_18595 [Armatimonas sp.]